MNTTRTLRYALKRKDSKEKQDKLKIASVILTLKKKI